jgi:hypothetical protein
MLKGLMPARQRGFVFWVLLAAVFALPSRAANFSFTGNFNQDDDRRVFEIVLNSPATLTMYSLSYGGGVNAAGATIARGGFDPLLSLFAGAGPSAVLINTNNDGPCPPLTQDSVTNACWDAFIQTSLPSGTYTLVLTQSDNTPLGPSLGDGFARDGQGNFTGPLFTGQPGVFWDANPNQRNSQWAVDILNVDAVLDVPEPASMLLVGSALLVFALYRRRASKQYYPGD